MNLHGFETTAPQHAQGASGRRYFTVSQANAAIPLVSRIVRDIVTEYETVMRARGAAGDELAGDDESQRQRAKDRLLSLARELEDIGCELKDWSIGLVDFPAMLEGREVCLCWKLGEPVVEHWHDIDAGFPGRKPISSSTSG